MVRVNDTFDAYAEAEVAYQATQAAYRKAAILHLRDAFAAYPWMESVTVEREYCYDDEGGYFASLTFYPQPESDEVEVEDVTDEFNVMDTDSLSALAGIDGSRGEGTITRAQVAAWIAELK